MTPDLRVDGAAIPRRRLWLVNAVITLVAGGSLICIALDREHWPFSQYPMFSRLHDAGRVSQLFLYGVRSPGEGEGREVELSWSPYLRPFDHSRVQHAFERIVREHPGDRDRLAAALHDLLARYEARRLAGKHPGPPLRGVRLYRYVWEPVEPGQRRAKDPDRCELLAEVRLPQQDEGG